MSGESRSPAGAMERILARLAYAEHRIALLEARLAGVGLPTGGGGSSGGGAPRVADDADLDGKYGDPVIRFEPRDLSGPSFKGSRMSETSAEYLHALAEYMEQRADWEESQPAKAKYAAFTRKDAARARGWAKRLRDGWKAPVREAAANPFATQEAAPPPPPSSDIPVGGFDANDRGDDPDAW